MKKLSLFHYGSAAIASAYLLSLLSLHASPINFPASGTYSENFDGALGMEWTMNSWAQAAIPTGVTQMTGNGGGVGQVRNSAPNGLNFAANFPIPALTTVTDYTNHGFGGQYLSSQAGTGTSVVEFVNLPTHTELDIDFLLIAGDSIDGTDTPFIVRVDGVEVLNVKFSAGGQQLNGQPGVNTLFTGANGNVNYREQWNDNAGAGPADENDRFAVTWTLESGYDLSAFDNFTAIPHTSDSLTVEIIHGLDGTPFDEIIAIDNFALSINAIPEPGSFSLLAIGLLALRQFMRRRATTA